MHSLTDRNTFSFVRWKTKGKERNLIGTSYNVNECEEESVDEEAKRMHRFGYDLTSFCTSCNRDCQNAAFRCGQLSPNQHT